MGDDDYDVMVKRIFGEDLSEDEEDWTERPDFGPAEDSDAFENGSSEEEENDGSPEEDDAPERESLEEGSEHPAPEPVPDIDWLSEGLSVMLDDPFSDALDIAEEVYDDCLLAAEWWESSDYDDRAIIDRLIEEAAA